MAHSADSDSPSSLREQIAAHTWYHTIELPGDVITPGEYDTRHALRRIPFPSNLKGMRCLDIGTHDGFWAFEMERRGAEDVVAIDLDDPQQADVSYPVPAFLSSDVVLRGNRAPAAAFTCAHRALRSNVDRRNLSVYDLSTANAGLFDFAFIGTLLLHLRDPIAGLSAIRGVLRRSGQLLVNDGVSLALSLLHPWHPVHTLTLLPGSPFWWLPNVRGLERYVEKAGFRLLRGGGPYLVPRGAGSVKPNLPRTRTNFAWRALHERGMLHGWALGEAP